MSVALIVAMLPPVIASAQEASEVRLTPEEVHWRSANPVVRVGVFAGHHLPAETWVAGRPEGFGVDYARLLAERAGMRLEFRPFLDWEAVVHGDRGEHPSFDLLLGQSPLLSRPNRLAFLRPYEAGEFMLVVRRGDTRTRNGPHLAYARIVVERRFHSLSERLARRYPNVRLLFSSDGSSAMDMVASGQADAYIGATALRTRMLLQQREVDDLAMVGGVDIPPAPISLAVPKEQVMLLRILRRAEASLAREDINRLRQRWGMEEDASAPVPSATDLAATERAWLATLRPLRVGYEIDRAPYTFVDSEGRFDGLAADYVELFARELGLRLEMVPAQDWNSLQKMVRTHEVDMVAATMQGIFDAKDLLVSRPYERFPGVIVARLHGAAVAGPEDLAGRRVALREDTVLVQRLRELMPRSQLVAVGTNEAGLDLLAAGKVDAYVGTLPAIDALIRDRYAATLRVVGPVGVDREFGIGIVPEHAALLPLVDRVLSDVTEAERQSIRSRWLTTEYRYGVPWPWVIGGFIAGALILLIGAVAHTRLRRAWRAQAKAEAEVASQLRFQQGLLETIPYPVFVKDAEGRYLAVNKAYEAMFGVPRALLLKRTIAQTRHLDLVLDVGDAHELEAGVLTSGRSMRRELQVAPLQPGGKPRDVILWLHRFHSAPGDVAGLLGTFVDVTDIREAEARARASEQRLIDTNDRLPGAIVRISVQSSGRIVYDYVAGQTRTLFGRSPTQIMQARDHLRGIGPDDQNSLLGAIGQIVAAGGRRDVEFSARVNGDLRWTRASGGAPRPEADGSVVWCIYFADITDEKRQAQALVEAKALAEAAVAARSSFLAMMSHEIRTPMAAVIGLIELMAQTTLDHEQEGMLAMVQDSAGTLLQILDDVLDFSRIESGRLELEMRPFDIRALADGVMGLFAARAQEKGVRLHATVDWRLAGQHEGDAVRLRQVITNLLSNALKFTEAGHVELRIELVSEPRHGPQRVRISVVDTGIGIAPEQLSRLFQPFVQAENSITRRFGGTGLGLSICQRLAAMMDGEIQIRSARGMGTTAQFELPLPVVGDVESLPLLSGRTALLSTQDPMFERELANALSTLGFNLIEVAPADLGDLSATCADLFVVDTQIVRDGLLPQGAQYLRLVDASDLRGYHIDNGEVSLGGSPLFWRATVDACHAALGLPLPKSEAALPGHYAPRSARILVAEDHMTNRAVIARQLERLGYPHVLVENGEAALEELSKQSFDLLISDCHMPVMDGYALTRQIRAQESGTARHLPVIALSASALPEEVRRCHEAGMDDFLAKPVQLLELELKLAAHLPQPVEAQAVVTSALPARTGRKLARLIELFGGEASLRDVLVGLLESSNRDVIDLDIAFEAGDEAQQRDILHRVDGALLLLAEGDAPQPRLSQLDHAVRRTALLARIRNLEAVIATLRADPEPHAGAA